MSAFVFGEALAVQATGLSVKLFQKARVKHLKQDVDWGLNGGHVAYEKKAFGRVLALVAGTAIDAAVLEGLEKKCALAEAEKKEAAPAPTIATVARFYMNRQRMGVFLPDEKKTLVVIKVNATTNFRRLMKVPVRLNAQNQWELARRLPRFPGRW